MQVVVMPRARVRAWDGQSTLEGIPLHPIVDIWEALQNRYDTDAHFVPYRIVGEQGMPRLRKTALAHIRARGTEVVFDCLVYDVDAPAHGVGMDAAEMGGWMDEEVIVKLDDFTRPCTWYRTRGGARLIVPLPMPLVPEEWSPVWQSVKAELEGVGIAPDPEIRASDWGRLYRLPRVRRQREDLDLPLSLDDTPAIRWERGQRNALLTSVAGALRRVDRLEVDRLGELNQGLLDPPLELAEVDAVVESMMAYEPEQRQGPFIHGDEQELAEQLLTVLEGDQELVFDRNRLYRFSGGRWTVVSEGDVWEVMLGWKGYTTARGPLRLSVRLMRNTLLLTQMHRTHEGYFDDRTRGVPFANGLLTGGRLIEYEPEHRALWQLPYNYNPDATCPRWQALLRDVLVRGEDRATLQEFFGAALAGETSAYKRAIVLHGSGDNGKSQVLHVLEALFPADQVASVVPQAMEQEYYRHRLSTARLNVVNEMPAADVTATEALKAVISGDTISAREIREKAYEYIPQVACVFAANELPRVVDHSAGFWVRFIVLHFDQTIPLDRQVPGIGRDIVAEELEGIAAWAVEGARRLARQGTYTESQVAKSMRATWRTEADQVAMFLQDEAGWRQAPDQRGDEWTPARDLYARYRTWSMTTGHATMSQTSFGRRLTSLGVRRRRASRGNLWNVGLPGL